MSKRLGWFLPLVVLAALAPTRLSAQEQAGPYFNDAGVVSALTAQLDSAAADATQAQVRGRKSPAVAFLLSFLLTGAGQGYNGQWGKGGLMFGGAVVSLVVAAVGATDCFLDALTTQQESCGLFYVGLVGAIGFPLWSIIDAPISASNINKKLSGAASLEVGPRLHVGLAPVAPSATRGFASAVTPYKLQPRVGLSLVRVRF